MNITRASVASALSVAHASLLEQLRRLEEAVTEQSLPEFRDRLRAVRIQIAEHFRFEEQDGYMETVRKQQPRLERAVRELGAEHPQLLQALDAIVADTRTAAALSTTVRQSVQAWIDRVRQHEACENGLVQNAFNQDISAED